MRIGLLTTSFPRDDHDLAGRFVKGFARALASRGHELEVLAPEPLSGSAPAVAEGLRVVHLPYLRPRALQRTFYGAGVPDNLRNDPLAWLGLAPFAASLAREANRRAAEWDAIVSHWCLPSALVAGLVRKGKPHLAVTHSADLFALSKLPARAHVARLIAQSATAMLFVSEPARDAFIAMLPPETRPQVVGIAHVSAMGIDPPESTMDRRRARKSLGVGGFVLAAMSRLVPIKGLDLVLDAIAGRDDVSLLLAGDGPERAALERHARARDARVRFLGVVHGEQKAALLAAADAFVAPSRVTLAGRTEGVPTAVLEAMAAGLPVIATRSGGLATTVRHEHDGLLVEEGSREGLRDAVTRLASDAALRRRLARHARTTGASYAWPLLAPRLEELLVTT